jgi:hypothetical protein
MGLSPFPKKRGKREKWREEEGGGREEKEVPYRASINQVQLKLHLLTSTVTKCEFEIDLALPLSLHIGTV